MSGDSVILAGSLQPDLGSRTEWLYYLAISAGHSTAPEAGATRRHAIELLREDTRSALDTARRLVGDAALDPLLRWSLVSTVTALEQEACVEFLRDQALTDFGERNPESCGEARDSEILVAIMAAEGIVSLAESGSAKAYDALIDIIRHQREPGVRESAADPLIRMLKESKSEMPGDIVDELDRIAALRKLETGDVLLDVGDTDRSAPTNPCGRKPAVSRGFVAPTARNPEGGHHD